MEMEELVVSEEDEELLAEASEKANKSKRMHPIWEYFDINAEKKEWTCKLCGNSQKKPFSYKGDCAKTNVAKKT